MLQKTFLVTKSRALEKNSQQIFFGKKTWPRKLGFGKQVVKAQKEKTKKIIKK